MLIAIVRRSENRFVQFFLDKGPHQHQQFTVPKNDSYREMTYGNIIYSEFDEKTHASQELARITVFNPPADGGSEPTMVDLSPKPIHEVSKIVRGMAAEDEVRSLIESSRKELKH